MKAESGGDCKRRNSSAACLREFLSASLVDAPATLFYKSLRDGWRMNAPLQQRLSNCVVGCALR